MSIESTILIPGDKANHCIYGAIFAFLVLTIAHALKVPHYPLTAIVAAGIVGALKELADWLVNRDNQEKGLPPSHDVDFWDFFATTCGGLFVFATAYI